MGYVFISYSSKNQEESNAVKNYLNRNGINTWMAPGDIPAGSQYAEVITQSLKNCDCVVLLLTAQSQDSIWVNKEVERAIHYNKAIIPLQLGEVVLNDAFEFLLASNQVIAVMRIEEESEAMGRFIASIKANVYPKKDVADGTKTFSDLDMDYFEYDAFYNEILRILSKRFPKEEIERLKSVYSEMEDEVGDRLLGGLSNDELKELASILEREGDFVKISAWFDKHVPNYVDIVADVVMDRLMPNSESVNNNKWGPKRPTFKMDTPSDYPTFNSIIDNPTIGDERNFVKIGEITPEKTELQDAIEIKSGKQYLVYIYIHNNASAAFNDIEYNEVGVARGTKVSVSIPPKISHGVETYVKVAITAENSNPKTVWDSVLLSCSQEDILLSYVEGSAKIYNDGKTNGSELPSELFLPEGTPLGFNELNGEMPGCEEYHGVVRFVFKAEKKPTYTRVGRNDLCPCGSGKKYKNCCGR